MPSRYKVSPAGAASNVRLTFSGKTITELLDCSPLEVGDREGDAVSGEAAEVVPGGRNRERATRHAGDGYARMHMSFVQEVDIPGVGAGGQCAVLRVGCTAAEGDDIARPEGSFHLSGQGWWRPADCRH